MAEERNEKRAPARVHDSDVSRVLERALELDQLNSQYVSADRLKAIALEAGISTESIDAALAELDASASVAASTSEKAEHGEGKGWFKSLFAKPKWTKWTKAAAWLALPVGAAVGLSALPSATVFAGYSVDSLLRMLAITSGSALIALEPETARRRPIVVAVILYWIGYVLGGSRNGNIGFPIHSWMIDWAIVSCSISLIVGNTIALIQSARMRSVGNNTPPAPGSKNRVTRNTPVRIEKVADLGDKLGHTRIIGNLLRDVMRGAAGERRAEQPG